MIKTTFLAALAALFVLTTGCASIVSKSIYPITFRTNPSEANIVITDKGGKEIFRGQSPATLTLSASNGFWSSARYDVIANKAGFHEAKGSVTARVDGWVLGNIIFGGLLGLLIVDPATGAMWQLPSDHVVNLTAQNEAPPPANPLLVSVTDLPEELQKKLIPIKAD